MPTDGGHDRIRNVAEPERYRQRGGVQPIRDSRRRLSSSPEELRSFMVSEIKKYHDVLEAAGIKPQ